jgi:hypothetical protein
MPAPADHSVDVQTAGRNMGTGANAMHEFKGGGGSSGHSMVPSAALPGSGPAGKVCAQRVSPRTVVSFHYTPGPYACHRRTTV